MRFLIACLLVTTCWAEWSLASVVKVYAAGTTGNETMELQISGSTVRTFRKVRTGSVRQYYYATSKKIAISQIRVRYSNDGKHLGKNMALRVAKINLDGKDYLSNAPTTFSTGTWDKASGCSPGYKQSRTLHCNGYFQYKRGNSNPSTAPAPNPTTNTNSQWQLTFSENFSGTQLNQSKWNIGPDWGRINGEEQAYVPEAIRISGGMLRIYAERIPTWYHGQTMPFRSGMITTKGKFSQTYGKFELRCKLPKGNGYWPAMWILEERPAALQKEIDVMETVGNLPTLASFNFHHLDNNDNHKSYYSQWWGPDFTAGFHTYAMEWSPNRLVWYVDGVERNRIENGFVPNRNMYILLNLAVGGGFPNATNTPPDATTPQKSALVVDYVRVYKRAN